MGHLSMVLTMMLGPVLMLSMVVTPGVSATVALGGPGLLSRSFPLACLD